MKTRKWPFIYVGVITVITYIPIIMTVIYSFNVSKLTSVWEGFSLKWYEELFRDRDLKEALMNSLILAALSCSCAVLIGTTGALGMYRAKRQSVAGGRTAGTLGVKAGGGRLNDVIAYVAMLPIMIPEIILGMVFLSIFSLMGLPFGMVTLVIAHTTFCVPYVYSMVKARLVGLDKSLEEAALDLGASPVRVFFDITLPQIMPAILSGVMLAFAMSFDDVVISIFVTGPKVNTLPVKIYTKLKTGVTPEINALATVMLSITVTLILASSVVGKIRVRNVYK
ncbi:MAG: ABC transporter permease [Lachnospiraceae bacterium]|nr:ABC transporter permease [Lachnospiraceae bacterium]